MNFRIQIFDRDGNFLSTFGKLGDGTGDFSKPKGIAVIQKAIYMLPMQTSTMFRYLTGTERLLLSFGNTGRRKGEMVLPAGIFIDGTGQDICG